MTAFRPSPRLLLHPLWLGALGLLIVNDHVLKHAGLLPGALTGKLSDLAGMVVAPWLLAALVGARSTRVIAACHAAVGLVFAAIKLSPEAAGAFEALTALTPFPWAITVDPTDLIALPVLALSALVLGRALVAPPPLRPWAARAAFGVGALACMATSPPEPEPGGFPPLTTDLVIANDTDDALSIRVRALKDTVHVDCDAIAADPTGALSRKLFAPATVWVVDPGRAFGVRGDQATGALTEASCHVYLVDGGGLPFTLLFWRAEDYPITSLPSTVDGAVAERTITAVANETGRGWTAHPARHAPPPATDPGPRPGCELPAAESGLAWSEPVPYGERTLLSVTSSPDGCHALELSGAGELARWYVCTGQASFPFVAGESLFFSMVTNGQDFRPLTGVDLLSQARTLRLGRGSDVVPFGKGFSSVVGDPGCAGGVHDACGDLVLPLQVEVGGDGALEGTRLQPGSAVEIGGGVLRLVRAQRLPIADSACLPAAANHLDLIESVFVKENAL